MCGGFRVAHYCSRACQTLTHTGSSTSQCAWHWPQQQLPLQQQHHRPAERLSWAVPRMIAALASLLRHDSLPYGGTGSSNCALELITLWILVHPVSGACVSSRHKVPHRRCVCSCSSSKVASMYGTVTVAVSFKQGCWYHGSAAATC
jgi:hypothetical protein